MNSICNSLRINAFPDGMDIGQTHIRKQSQMNMAMQIEIKFRRRKTQKHSDK